MILRNYNNVPNWNFEFLEYLIPERMEINDSLINKPASDGI